MIKTGVHPADMSAAEIGEYKQYMHELHPEVTNGTLDIVLDGEYVELSLKSNAVPFQRIRRITGYLVGTLDRFNNAKYAEVHDRVKHGIGE